MKKLIFLFIIFNSYFLCIGQTPNKTKFVVRLNRICVSHPPGGAGRSEFEGIINGRSEDIYHTFTDGGTSPYCKNLSGTAYNDTLTFIDEKNSNMTIDLTTSYSWDYNTLTDDDYDSHSEVRTFNLINLTPGKEYTATLGASIGKLYYTYYWLPPIPGPPDLVHVTQYDYDADSNEVIAHLDSISPKLCSGEEYQIQTTYPAYFNKYSSVLRFEWQQENYTEGGIWNTIRTNSISSLTITDTADAVTFDSFISKQHQVRVVGEDRSSEYSKKGAIINIFGPPPVLEFPSTSSDYILNSDDLDISNTYVDINHAPIYGDAAGNITFKNIKTEAPELAFTIRDNQSGQGYNFNADTNNLPTIPVDPNLDLNNIEDDYPNGFPGGEYTIVIENIAVINGEPENLCFFKDDITIRQPKPVQATIRKEVYPGGKNISCHDSEDGRIEVIGTGGLGNYTIRIEGKDDRDNTHISRVNSNIPKGTSTTFNNLPKYPHSHTHSDSLLYSINVTDQYDNIGFTKDLEFLPDTTNFDDPQSIEGDALNLTSPDTLKILDVLPNKYDGKGPAEYNIQCYEGTDSITVYTLGGSLGRWVSAGIGNSKYAANELVTPTLTGLAVGEHTIVVTDTNNCTASTTITLNEAPKLELDSVISMPPCHQDKGAIRFRAVSGYDTDLYNYLVERDSEYSDSKSDYWHTTYNELNKLDTGKYEVTVEQTEKNCIDTFSFTIKAPPPFAETTELTHIARAGEKTGSMQIILDKGHPPYRIEDDVPFRMYSHYSDTLLFDTLSGGTYFFSILDTNNCSITKGITIEERSPLTLFKDSTNISCYGANDGTVTLTASGGWYEKYYFGTYPHIDSLYPNPDLLHPESITYTNLAKGFHTYYVADSMYQMDSVKVYIAEPRLLTVGISRIRDISCNGGNDGEIEIEISGGTPPFSINNGSPVPDTILTIPSLYADNYTITVEDANDCFASVDTTLIQPNEISIASSTITKPLCNESNGKIFLVVSGGVKPYEAEWTKQDVDTFIQSYSSIQDTTILPDISSGTYDLVITDSIGCTLSRRFFVSDSLGPEAEVNVLAPVSCYESANGSAKVVSVRPELVDSILWQNKETSDTAITLTRTDTMVTVTDVNGCISHIYYHIPYPDTLTVNEFLADDPVCTGESNGTIEVISSGGTGSHTYSWDYNNASGARIENLPAGNYTATVTDQNNCKASTTIALYDPDPVLVDLGGDQTICLGQSVTLSPAGYAAYEWRFNNEVVSTEQEVEFHEAGTYSLTVFNEYGCAATDQFELFASASVLNAEFIMSTETAVGDTIVIVEVSWPAPDSIRWEFDEGITVNEEIDDFAELTFDQAGIYNVTLYAAMGNCRDQVVKQITVSDFYNHANNKNAKPALIKNFEVFPNPNNKLFTAKAELNRKAEVNIKIIEMKANTVLFEQSGYDDDIYEIEFNLPSLSPGIYLVMLQAEDEVKVLKVVIQ